jgi:hypothetical protein
MPFNSVQAIAKDLGNRPAYGLQADRSDILASRTIEGYASRLIEQLRQLQVQGPKALMFRGFGSATGLEVAQRLRASGEVVAVLVLFEPARLDNLVQANHGGQNLKSTAARLIRVTRRHFDLVSKFQFRELLRSIHSRLQLTLYRTFVSLPFVWKYANVPDCFHFERAGRSYVPRTYPGSVLLLCSSSYSASEDGRAAVEGWAKCCPELIIETSDSAEEGLGDEILTKSGSKLVEHLALADRRVVNSVKAAAER